MNVLSYSEELVIFVTLEGEDPARIVAERNKTVYSCKVGKRK